MHNGNLDNVLSLLTMVVTTSVHSTYDITCLSSYTMWLKLSFFIIENKIKQQQNTAKYYSELEIKDKTHGEVADDD